MYSFFMLLFGAEWVNLQFQKTLGTKKAAWLDAACIYVFYKILPFIYFFVVG